MSTDLQRDLAEAIVENKKKPHYKRKNKRDLLVSTGYSVITAESIPSKIIEAKGVKDALREMGLTEELVTEALVSDINEKAKNRLGELRLASEILGMNENDKGGNKTLILNVLGETSQRYDIRIPPDTENSSS